MRFKDSAIALLLAATVMVSGVWLMRQYFDTRLPASLDNLLRTEGIRIESSRMRTSLWPAPHLVIDQLFMRIDDDTELLIRDLHAYPDLAAALITGEEEISELRIGYSHLRVLDVPSRKPRTAINVPRVMERIRRLTTLISFQFNLARRVEIDRFELVLDQIDPDTLFLYTENLLLQADERSVKIRTSVKLRDYLEASLRVSMMKSANPDQWLQSVIVDTVASVNLARVRRAKSGFQLEGNLNAALSVSFSFPLERMDGVLEAHVLDFGFTDRNNNFNRSIFRQAPLQRLEFALTGNADSDNLSLSELRIRIGDERIRTTLDWIYEAYRFDLRFSPGSRLDIRELTKALGNAFTPTQKAELSRSRGFLYPAQLRWSPWRRTLSFDGTARITHPVRLGKDTVLNLNTGFHGDGAALSFTNAMVTMGNSRITMPSGRVRFDSEVRFQIPLVYSISLADVHPDFRGTVNGELPLHCASLPSLNCNRLPFSLAGRGITVSGATAQQAYDSLSTDFSKLWKNSVFTKRVQIRDLQARGHLEQDRIVLDEGILKSDIGIFRSSGYFGLPDKSGWFTLRMLPMQMENAVTSIPLLGGALHNTLSFALEFVFEIEILRGEQKISAFSLGRGVSGLRSLIRGNPARPEKDSVP